VPSVRKPTKLKVNDGCTNGSGDAGRLAGSGTLDQILDDLGELRRLGADAVVLDPYHGDPEETRRPEVAWRALTTVAANWRTAS
jgi:glyoxylase-like metal-dependent hydrolase (beta-lactamase superfamily II)